MSENKVKKVAVNTRINGEEMDILVDPYISLLETLREVLEGPNKIILDDSGSGQGVVPYLPLNELKNNKQSN